MFIIIFNKNCEKDKTLNDLNFFYQNPKSRGKNKSEIKHLLSICIQYYRISQYQLFMNYDHISSFIYFFFFE